jgi:hypothetical protein
MDPVERFKHDVRTSAAGVGVRLTQVAEATGITRGTLKNIYYGQSKDTGYSKAEKLRQFYEGQVA